MMSLKSLPQDLLYQSKRPVSVLKKKTCDLLQFIPPVYHDFCNNLTTVECQDDDIGPLPDIDPEAEEN